MSDRTWVDVCDVGEIDEEDVFRFDHGGKVFAVYHSPDGQFFATDGLCTHEKVSLADGLVMDDVVECPKHNGRFNYKTGQALSGPVCKNLGVYPVRLDGERILIAID